MSGPGRRGRPRQGRDGIEELSQEDVERRILGLEGATSRVRHDEPAAAEADLPAGEPDLPATDAVADDDGLWALPAAATPAALADETPGFEAPAADLPPAPRVPFEARGEEPRRPVRSRRAAVETERARPTVRAVRRDAPTITRRALLTRDASTLVAGGLLALVLGRVIVGAGSIVLPSGTPDYSQVAVIESDGTLPGFSEAAPATMGGVVNASLGLDATPTPIPVITKPPEPTPTPFGQTPGPGETPKPTGTPGPTAPPTQPVVSLSCPGSSNIVTNDTASCTVSVTGGPATSFDWDWGDGTTGPGGASNSHQYTVQGFYSVSVTVHWAGGTVPTNAALINVNDPTPAPS